MKSRRKLKKKTCRQTTVKTQQPKTYGMQQRSSRSREKFIAIQSYLRKQEKYQTT